MQLKRLFWIAPTTLLLFVSLSWRVNFSVPFAVSPVVGQTSDTRTAEADELMRQAYQQIEDNQFDAAIQSIRQGLMIYREIKDRRSEAFALVFESAIRQTFGVGDAVGAIELCKQSFEIAREIKDNQLESAASECLQKTQNPNYLRKVEANRLRWQGDQQFNTAQYEAALQSSQQALAIYQEIKDLHYEQVTLNDIGIAYLFLGNYDKASESLQQSLTIARDIKDRDGEGDALGNLGLVYFSVADYEQAMEYFQQALVITRETKDRLGEGRTLGNLGNAYIATGDYAKGIEYQQQSLSIARELNHRHLEGNSLRNLGTGYIEIGDFTKALEYLGQSLVIAREIKDRQGELESLGALGNVYAGVEDYAKAREYFQQFLAIAKGIKSRDQEIIALGSLAATYRDLGDDYTKAIEYQQQTLALAQEIKKRDSEATALVNLGKIYRSLGDLTRAIEYYQKSLKILREIGDNEGQGFALNSLGYAFMKSGNLTEAEKYLRASMEIKESLRKKLGEDSYKVSIFERQASTYRLLERVLIAQNKTNDALEIAERGRARAFVELLQTRLSANTKGEGSSPLPPTIEHLQQIAKQQKATLVEYSISDDEFKISGLQKYLESELYIWVIKPTGEVTFRKADLKPLWQQQNTSLANLVTTTRNSIGVDDRSIFQAEVVNPVDEGNQAKRLQQLHQLLIAPITDLLPTDPNQHIIFVPQNELFLVPFAALQDEQGKYLIEKHTILTAPSIQVLELTRASREKVKQAAAKDAIVVGNPTMPSVPPKIGEKPQQLASLPGAKREAEGIAPVLNTKALTGNEATKAAVLARLSQARIVHLATHGLFDDFQGLQSAIALAPNNNDNGLLTAEEILNLKLNADLVVLSACNTGRGRITGDGVIGLSRSLFIAGTPSVIVSLWAVPDAPTAELMTEFYRQLKQTGDKAQSLRQAMLKMKEKYPNTPNKWAAFTLIGEAH